MVYLLIVFFVLMFFLFVFAFRRIINKNVSSAVQHLDKINQDYLKKEEEANKKLEEADRIYQETITKAKEEALSLREDVLKQTQKEKEDIVQKARAQAQDIIQQAEKTRHLLISELEEKINRESIKKASDLLSQALPSDIQNKIHNHLVKDFIENALKKLENLDIPQDLEEIKVISSFALEKKDKESVVDIFKEKLGRNFKIIEEVNPQLVAGFMVVLGNLVIDGSLKFKIEEEVKELIAKE